MRTLLFDANGTCLKAIYGDAIPDIPGATAITCPVNLLSTPVRRLMLSGGVVQQIPLTPEEISDIAEVAEISTLSNWKTLFRVLVWMVNEIRGLQGKQPITRAQALAAISNVPK